MVEANGEVGRIEARLQGPAERNGCVRNAHTEEGQSQDERHQKGERGQEPEGPTHVEDSKVDATPLNVLADEDARDEVAGQDEEDQYTDEARAIESNQMGGEDKQNRDAP
ncbi:hypothetical protein IDVR_33630 [Intrasporangium sp. DVR]